MKFKHLINTALLVLAPSLSFAETITLKTEDIFMGYNYIYPNLDLVGISDIDVRVEKTFADNGFEPVFDIKKIEFKFPNANNLKVQGFEKLEGSPDTYRAIVTSPWVFKKLMVEVKAFEFAQDQNMEVSVIVVEKSSNINNIAQVEGERLFGGSAKLVDVSPKKVVDVLRTNYLGKALTLRLYDKTLPGMVQIQAVWMGHGTQILTLNAPTHPNMKSVAILSETIGDDQRIRVSMTDGFGTIESQDESLHLLLEQKFGPLPYPEPAQ
jgi:hypothetical protein